MTTLLVLQDKHITVYTYKQIGSRLSLISLFINSIVLLLFITICCSNKFNLIKVFMCITRSALYQNIHIVNHHILCN